MQKDYSEDAIHLGAKGTVECLTYDATSRYLAVGMSSDVYITREVAKSLASSSCLCIQCTHRTEDQYKGAQKYPPPRDADETSTEPDTRVRPVALHFANGGKSLIVSYLNHGIVFVPSSCCRYEDIANHVTCVN